MPDVTFPTGLTALTPAVTIDLLGDNGTLGGDITIEKVRSHTMLAAGTGPATFDDLVAIQGSGVDTQTKVTVLDGVLALGKKFLVYKRWDFLSFSATADEGMGLTNTGAGSTAYGFGSGNDAFGVANLEAGTTSTGVSAVSCSNICRVTGGRVLVSARFRIPTLSNATNRFTSRFGALDEISFEPANGIYFRQVDNVNGARLEGVVRAANTETVRDLGVIPTANTWAHCHWIANAAGTSIQFYLNGTATGAEVTTNIPTTINLRIGASVIASAGTVVGRQLHLDWLDLAKEFTTSRS
jgi:hypothetical protein